LIEFAAEEVESVPDSASCLLFDDSGIDADAAAEVGEGRGRKDAAGATADTSSLPSCAIVGVVAGAIVLVACVLHLLTHLKCMRDITNGVYSGSPSISSDGGEGVLQAAEWRAGCGSCGLELGSCDVVRFVFGWSVYAALYVMLCQSGFHR
jgi:hypothetical protein